MFIEQDNPKNFVLTEPELEFLEFELYDPNIQNQIDLGYNVEYKIPESYSRTMPIEQIVENIQNRHSGDWLDCAARNSGIPKWLLLIAIAYAIIVALWLGLSYLERRLEHQESDETCLIRDEENEEKDQSFYNRNINIVVGNENTFSEPEYKQQSLKV